MAIYCVNFGVNFFFQKFCPCKKNDKYEVWRPSHIVMHCALHLGGGGCDCGVHGALYCSWLRFPLLIGLPLHLFGSSLGQMFYLQSFWGGDPLPQYVVLGIRKLSRNYQVSNLYHTNDIQTTVRNAHQADHKLENTCRSG